MRHRSRLLKKKKLRWWLSRRLAQILLLLNPTIPGRRKKAKRTRENGLRARNAHANTTQIGHAGLQKMSVADVIGEATSLDFAICTSRLTKDPDRMRTISLPRSQRCQKSIECIRR